MKIQVRLLSDDNQEVMSLECDDPEAAHGAIDHFEEVIRKEQAESTEQDIQEQAATGN